MPSFLLGNEIKKRESKKAPAAKKQKEPTFFKKRKKVDVNYEKARIYYNNDLNGITKIFPFTVEGKIVPCLCKNGRAETKNKKLCEYLENHGFRFMGEMKDEDFDEYEYEDYLEDYLEEEDND